MKLFALSDLHLGYERNREFLRAISPSPDDWLILAGDIGETLSHLELAFKVLTPRFQRLVWVPGNHELWTALWAKEQTRGQYKYEELVRLCRRYRVITPEDPYPILTIGDQEVRIIPLFLLYDYSFRPPQVPLSGAVDWAKEAGVWCMDEVMLHSDPYLSIPEWCHERCATTERRLMDCIDGRANIMVNHFPLRRDLVCIPRIPRFSIWCGTHRTEDWHLRFNAKVVVSGHLHVRSTMYRDGVRFEEVSLGYPRQWIGIIEPRSSVRQIFPALSSYS
jgi:3',5'-cyclic AMP phosphodiesterase CpdA